MTISFTTIEENEFLRIVSTGLCQSLDQLKVYVLAIHKAMIEARKQRVLVDETGVVYKLGTVDSFYSGCFVSEMAPRHLKIAVLCRPEGWSEAKFWETVAGNRGVSVRIFQDYEHAESWIRYERLTY